jgi:hypothetical protein
MKTGRFSSHHVASGISVKVAWLDVVFFWNSQGVAGQASTLEGRASTRPTWKVHYGLSCLARHGKHANRLLRAVVARISFPIEKSGLH